MNPARVSVHEWGCWVDAFGRHLAAIGRSEATIDGYCKHVAWLAADAHGEDPWSVTPAFLSDWLDEQNWSALTRRKVLVSLRAFYAWGLAEAQLQRSPMAGLGRPPARKRGPQRIQPSPKWREPLQEFLTWMEAGGRRPASIEQRRWQLTRLGETFADPWAVTTQDLALWLSRGDWAPETKRLARSSAQNFYAWAERVGYLPASPARWLPSVMVPRTLPRPTPDDVVVAALAGCDPRVRLAIMFAAYAGLRRSEIVGLLLSDIGDTAVLVRGKGGHQRLVPLHPALRAAVAADLRRRETDRAAWPPPAQLFLFPSSHGGHLTPHHLAKLVSAALGPGWTLHSLRHRFASQAYAGGRDLRAVQQLLGHVKPETTARYAAVPDGALEAAVIGIR